MILKRHFWKINKKKRFRKENYFCMIILYANIYEIRGRSPKKIGINLSNCIIQKKKKIHKILGYLIKGTVQTQF